MQITFKGTPLIMAGKMVQEGDTLPDVELTAQDMSPVRLLSLLNKKTLIITVPSLDTPVCDTEIKKFLTRLKGKDMQVLIVSRDLPFAQKRWCAASNGEAFTFLSDFKQAAFAITTGLYIQKLGLLARALLVTDKTGKVTYRQIVREVTDEPNYDEVLTHLQTN